MCKVFLAKARFVRRILACMVNFASNERYGGEGLRERLMEQGLKLPLSHPRPQVRLSFPPPLPPCGEPFKKYKTVAFSLLTVNKISFMKET